MPFSPALPVASGSSPDSQVKTPMASPQGQLYAGLQMIALMPSVPTSPVVAGGTSSPSLGRIPPSP